MKFTYKHYILMIICPLIVTIVRYQLQYGHPPWYNGILNFLAVWFIHYIGILLVSGCAVFLSMWYFGKEDREMNGLLREGFEWVLITLTVISIFVLILKHWTPLDLDDY